MHGCLVNRLKTVQEQNKYIYIYMCVCVYVCVYVTLDHKTSLKSYICSNTHCMGQNYLFFFYAKNH